MSGFVSSGRACRRRRGGDKTGRGPLAVSCEAALAFAHGYQPPPAGTRGGAGAPCLLCNPSDADHPPDFSRSGVTPDDGTRH